MNNAKLNARKNLTEVIQNDDAAAADYETLIAEITQVIVDGEAPESKLAELKPVLIALHRSGIDPVTAVETAIVSARIRARHTEAPKA